MIPRVSKDCGWREAIDAFVEFRRAVNRQKTTDEHLYRLNHWLKWADLHKVTIDNIQVQHIAAWLTDEKERGMCNNTCRYNLNKLRTFFNFLMGVDRMPKNPVNKMFLPRLPKENVERRTYTFEQYERVKLESQKKCYYECWRHMITIGWYTGLRMVDICFLKWSSVSWTDGVLYVKPRKKESMRERLTIPMDPEIDSYLLELWNQRDEKSEYVLPEAARLYAKKRVKMVLSFRRMCNELGLNRHTFHGFRHSFVSRLINCGIDPITIGSLTGQTIQQVQGYSHVSVDAKRVALAKSRNAVHQAKINLVLARDQELQSL